ncbi:PAIP1 family protein [Megaselia abdita]
MNNAAGDQPYFANNRQYRPQHQQPPAMLHLLKVNNGMNNMQMAGGLSANAPEFVPQQKFSAAQMNGNFNSHSHQQQQAQQFQQPQHFIRQQPQTHHHQQQQQQPPQQPQPQQQQPQHHYTNDFRNLPNLMNNLSVQQQQAQQQQPALVQQQQQHHFHHNHHNHNVNNRNQNHYRGKGGGGMNSVQNRLHRQNQQQHSHSQHHHVNHVNHHQQQQHQQQQPQQDSSHGGTSNGTSDGEPAAESAHSEQELMAIGFIETVIQELSDDPGTYDNISRKVLNIYENYQNNEFVLSNVMEIVFKRSIEEQNFRYMGAKLYGLFDLLDSSPKSLFRNLLALKLDYHQTEMLDFLQNDQIKVRGTAFFLAELYMQLRNDGTRLKIVAESIVLTINQLLNKPTPENIKCICMSLKLAGYDLEFDYPQEMQLIMTTLEEKVDTLDVSTSRVLENVLQLQKQKWGRKNEPTNERNGLGSSSSSPMHKFDLRASDEPVFYGPDGQVLSEEESSFLTSNFEKMEMADYDESQFPIAEMDEEAEKAFEDFLKCLEYNK